MAQVAPDTSFEERRTRVLEQIASRYAGTPSGQSCFDFGASSIGLVAKLELGERGHDQGVSVADVNDDIADLADRAVDWAGACHSKCVWGEAGSPGTMHALLALGMILHRYEGELPSNVVQKLEQAARGWWRADSWTECTTDGDDDGNESPVGPWLVNGNISIVAGHLLAGEVMGEQSEVWQDGLSQFNEIYETTVAHGGLEMNAPIYTAYQFAALVPLLELEHDEVRQKARILLDYLFLVHAHLYMPGGGLGAPQSRDYGGGAYDTYPSSLNDVLWFYTGDDPFAPDPNVHVIGAAVDYQLPEAVRSIYLNKGTGYDFWAYTPAPVKSRHGRGYDFGTEYPIAPWRAVVTPDAMLGVNHGFRYQAIHVSMGVYSRTQPETFPILYQYEPYIDGDKTRTGGGLPTGSGDTDPDDFTRELYDYRRMVFGRAAISLWDPREAGKPADVVRQAEDTRVHIPDYADFGGEMRHENTGGWFVGRAGDSYIAYHPLGSIERGPERRTSSRTGSGVDQNGDYFYLRLDGRSGGIVELATTDQFSSIDAYVSDLKGRHLEFTKGDPMYAEFDALDPETGETERMRLEYEPEKHLVGGTERPLDEGLDHGLVASPFVDFDSAERTLTVERNCHDRMIYDLDDAEVRREAPRGENCVGEPLDTTVFSDVGYYGDFANWTAEHADRWEVVEVGGDRRLFLAPFDFEKEEDRLGEIARPTDRTFGDFHMTLRAKTHENLDREDAADYAVVFGYQDHDNYYFLLANSHEEYSELFVLEDGVRTQLARADSPLIPDEDWHRLRVRRDGEAIQVELDTTTVLTATDDTFRTGAVGVGALNDSVLFDDISVGRLAVGDDRVSGDAGPSGGDPADAAEADSGSTGSADDRDSRGCNCRTVDSTPPLGALLFAVVSLCVLQRRRRDAKGSGRGPPGR